MKEFFLEILTPKKKFFEGNVEEIICRTVGGEMGILSGHENMVAALDIGEIKLLISGQWKSAFIDGGFAEVLNGSVSIFSKFCEWPEKLDEAKIMADKQAAVEKIQHIQNLKEHRESEISLARELAKFKNRNKFYKN